MIATSTITSENVPVVDTMLCDAALVLGDAFNGLYRLRLAIAVLTCPFGGWEGPNQVLDAAARSTLGGVKVSLCEKDTHRQAYIREGRQR
jgi:hypothetical protein